MKGREILPLLHSLPPSSPPCLKTAAEASSFKLLLLGREKEKATLRLPGLLVLEGRRQRLFLTLLARVGSEGEEEEKPEGLRTREESNSGKGRERLLLV